MVSAAASRRHTDISSSKYSIDPLLKTTLKGPFYGFTLKTSTWISDSHNLYDYESQYVSAKTYRCYGRSNEYRVIKKGIDVQLLTEEAAVSRLSQDASTSSIALITALEDGGYRIESVSSRSDAELRPGSQSADEGEDEDRRFWLVARSIPPASLPLTAGDTIKLGRCTYKIKRIVLHAHGKPDVHSPDSETQSSSSDGTAHDRTPGSKGSHRPSPRLTADVQPFGAPPAESDAAVETDPGRSEQVEKPNSPESVDSTRSNHEVIEPGPVSVPFGKCCRICLCDEESPLEDPLLTPCTCKGSMQWVHLKCLRTWMQGRLGVSGASEKQKCFFWEALECELCKAPYPTYVSVSGNSPLDAPPGADAFEIKMKDQDPIDRAVEAAISADRRSDQLNSNHVVELFAIPKPTVPFIVLECKQPNGTSGFYFLNFGPDNMLKLGRGHEADARVADISVSRVHAVLRYQSTPGALLTVLRDTQASSAEQKDGEQTNSLARDSLGSIVLPIRAAEPYVYIEDMKSKFGTLIAVDKPVYLYPKMMVSIQVGRTVITMHVRKPTWSRLLPSCFNVSYKSLLPRLRRRHTLEGDQRDIRLLETNVPFAISPSAVVHLDSPINQSQATERQAYEHQEADPLAATRPFET